MKMIKSMNEYNAINNLKKTFFILNNEIMKYKKKKKEISIIYYKI